MIRYWKEFLLFSAYFGLLIWCSPFDMSQLNCGDKCFTFFYSAWFFERLYDSPVYSSLCWLVVRLGFPEGFSLTFFLSILPALGSAVCVMLSTKRLTDNFWAPWISTLTLMSSWVFISQAIKVDVYSFTAFTLILAYTFLVYKRVTLAAVFFGLGMVTHWVTGVVAALAWFVHSDELRRKFYIMIPVPVIVIFLWHTFVPMYDPESNSNIVYIFVISWTVGPMSEIWGNLLRTVSIGLFVAMFGWIPILAFFYKDFRKSLPFIFIVLVPLSYMVIATSDSGYMQLAVAAPFLSIAAGLGMQHIKEWHIEKLLVICMLFIMFLSIFIWRIDSNPTSARDMINQMDNVPDDAKIVALRVYNDKTDTFGGAVTWMVDYYNHRTGRSLESIYIIEASEVALLTRNTTIILDALKDVYPDTDLYYYEIVELSEVRCELRKWE